MVKLIEIFVVQHMGTNRNDFPDTTLAIYPCSLIYRFHKFQLVVTVKIILNDVYTFSYKLLYTF